MGYPKGVGVRSQFNGAEIKSEEEKLTPVTPSNKRSISSVPVISKVGSEQINYKQIPIYNRSTRSISEGTSSRCVDIISSDTIDSPIDYTYQKYKLAIHDSVNYLAERANEIHKNKKLNANQFIEFVKESINFEGKLKLKIKGEIRQLIPLEEPDIEYFRNLDQEKVNELSDSLFKTLDKFYTYNFETNSYDRKQVINNLVEYSNQNKETLFLDSRIKLDIPGGFISEELTSYYSDVGEWATDSEKSANFRNIKLHSKEDRDVLQEDIETLLDGDGLYLPSLKTPKDPNIFLRHWYKKKPRKRSRNLDEEVANKRVKRLSDLEKQHLDMKKHKKIALERRLKQKEQKKRMQAMHPSLQEKLEDLTNPYLLESTAPVKIEEATNKDSKFSKIKSTDADHPFDVNYDLTVDELLDVMHPLKFEGLNNIELSIDLDLD